MNADSQACPKCGTKHHPSSREGLCASCWAPMPAAPRVIVTIGREEWAMSLDQARALRDRIDAAIRAVEPHGPPHPWARISDDREPCPGCGEVRCPGCDECK